MLNKWQTIFLKEMDINDHMFRITGQSRKSEGKIMKTLKHTPKHIWVFGVSQICGILIWLPIRTHFSVNNFWVGLFGIPIIISSVISFVAELVLRAKMNISEAIESSFPATIVYFLVYMVYPLLPSFIGNFGEQMSFFLLNTLIIFGPFTMLMLLGNSFSVYLASVICKK